MSGDELSSLIDEVNSKKDEHFDNYLIAYIDFLGMKNALALGDSYRTLTIIRTLMSNAKKRASAISRINYINDFNMKLFSDNAIIAIKIDKSIIKDQIVSMVNLLSLLQFEALFQFEYTLRGGITIGELHIDDSIVWGKGLVEAYRIEETLANYPRVIVDTKVLQAFDETKNDSLNIYALLKKDFDGLWYINYYYAVPNIKLIPPMSKSLSDMLKNNPIYSNIESNRIKQKVNWIIHTFNDLCIEMKDQGDYEKYIIPYIT